MSDRMPDPCSPVHKIGIGRLHLGLSQAWGAMITCPKAKLETRSSMKRHTAPFHSRLQSLNGNAGSETQHNSNLNRSFKPGAKCIVANQETNPHQARLHCLAIRPSLSVSITKVEMFHRPVQCSDQTIVPPQFNVPGVACTSSTSRPLYLAPSLPSSNEKASMWHVHASTDLQQGDAPHQHMHGRSLMTFDSLR
jgi:hypothetical protein